MWGNRPATRNSESSSAAHASPLVTPQGTGPAATPGQEKPTSNKSAISLTHRELQPAHKARFQHMALVPNCHTHNPGKTCPNQHFHEQLSSVTSPHNRTASGILPAQSWQSSPSSSPPHLGVSLLLPDEAVRRQPQLGYPGVPGILHQRSNLIGFWDVV